MSFKRKANKALALLLSLSLAMSTNMPVSALANEAEAPVKESSVAEIAYVMSGEEVIGISLNANPVVIQSATDVSGNTVEGSFNLILDADRDGVADADEEKLAIDGVTAFDSALNVYGIYGAGTENDILITMNSGSVAGIYGLYQARGGDVNINVNGGTAVEICGVYSSYYDYSGDIKMIVGEKATVTNEPEATSGYVYHYGKVYIDNAGALQIGGDYTFEQDLTLDSLDLLKGTFIIPAGVTLSAEALSTPSDYYDTAVVVIKGTLNVNSVSGNGKFLMAGGTILGTDAEGLVLYQKVEVEKNIATAPVSMSSYYSVGVEIDGVMEYYVQNGEYASVTASLQGYDIYYSINEADYRLVSGSSFYLDMPDTGTAKLVLEYVPKQISVENKYSAPKGVVGKTYTAENPLCDLSIYPITNDTTEEYGEVKYAVKKATPLPAGLSLVKGKIIGTPTVACEDGQKVTIVVTGRNGSTANLDLTIKIAGDGTDTKGINELVQVDVQNKKIDLNGTSVVVMTSPEDSYYDVVYLDMDHDKLPDNKEALIINERTYYDLSDYELIGYSDTENAYKGDISITVKAKSLKKVIGIYGSEAAPVTVDGDVSIYLESGIVTSEVYGVYYGKAKNVNLSATGSYLSNADMYGVYESQVTGDVNFVLSGNASVKGSVSTNFATVGVATGSTVGGDVNVEGGFESTDYGFVKYVISAGKYGYYTEFTGISDTTVDGSINYDIGGVWIPGTNTMVTGCTVGKDVVFNMASDHFSSDSPLVVDSTISGDLKLISDEETGFDTVSGDVAVISGTSAEKKSTVKGDLYIDIKKGGFGSYWEPIGGNTVIESGIYINNCELVSIGTAADGEYVIAEDMNGSILTLLEDANVKIAEGVNVTLSSALYVESGAKLVNNGTITMSSASGTITGTLENNGVLTTTATKSNGLKIAENGLVLNGEKGTWNVACYVDNSGKIVNYGSFVQTYSYSSGTTYYYAKLGKVYTTKPLTLSNDPATSGPYTTTDYQDSTKYHSELYYAINVDYPTHCAVAPALTGTEIVQSGVGGDMNKYIRVYRVGSGTSEFTLTPGTVTSESFALESVTYGSDATEIEGTTTYTASVEGKFEPIIIKMNYAAVGEVTNIKLEKDSDTVTNLAVDQVYSYENPLYDLTEISISDDITAENGKVMYSVKTGTLPDGIELKDGKLYGRFTTATSETTDVVFTVQGLNLTTADFMLTFGEVAKAVPQWEVPAALTATVGQTLADVELPTDERGTYSWVVGTDTAETFDEATTVEKEIYFAPSDLANYDWTAVSGWDEEDEIILFDIAIEIEPTDIEVTVPTDLTAIYGQTFADIAIPADENGTFAWDTEYHETTDFVGDAGEQTCYVTYVPTSKNYKTKSGIAVTLTVNPAPPQYSETLTEVSVLCDETLGDVLLPDVDGGKYQWVSATSTAPTDGVSYSVIYLPEDTTNYDWSTVDGWHKYRKGIVFSVTVKLEHAWDEGVVTTPATTTSTGVKTYKCGLCDETRTETIEKLPQTGGGTGGTSGGTGGTGGGSSSGGTGGGSAPSNPQVGYAISDSGSKAVYKVSKVGAEVTYVKPNKKTYTNVKIPKTIKYEGSTYKVTAIANNAFKNNKKLKKVTIGANIKTIGNNAFYNCSALKLITIPKNVSKIGSKAFYNCKKLTKMTIKTSKLTQKNVGKKAFTKMGSSNYKKVTVKVPKKKLKAYKKMLQKRGLSKKAKVK